MKGRSWDDTTDHRARLINDFNAPAKYVDELRKVNDITYCAASVAAAPSVRTQDGRG